MRYDLDSIIDSALNGLGARQKKIIKSRYGLENGRTMTLMAIGDNLNVTRERIRQIEGQVLNFINNQPKSVQFKNFVQSVSNILNDFKGVRRHDHLLEDIKSQLEKESIKNAGNKLMFILRSSNSVKYYPANNDFHAFWYLNDGNKNDALSFISKLIYELKDGRREKATGVIAENYVSLSKKFATNSYGDFGLTEWADINPKVSRDWAYLILKKESEPLHFLNLAAAINKVKDGKKVNPQTIHNELIKDDRFVLVGRGTYGLREFNIIPGTAREVITHFLKQHGSLSAGEVVKVVSEQRAFKEKTLLLNLQNKKFFKRSDNGKYSIKEV